MKRFFALFFCLSCIGVSLPSWSQVRVDTLTYKNIDGVSLGMHVFYPVGWNSSDNRPAIVLFFGGGWNQGSPSQFRPQALELAGKGMVVFLPDYRIGKRYGTTPFESVSDARSAIRFVRGHAGMLGVDKEKIAAGGGSAGGHLALCCAMAGGVDNYGDDLRICCRPDLLVLFNPVVDTSPQGFGYGKIGERYSEISPMDLDKGELPRFIIFHGKEDTVVSPESVKTFVSKARKAGVKCRLIIYKGQEHGFFNKKKNSDTYYRKTFEETVRFLEKNKFIKK